jgi:hypothetical protein
MLSWISGYIIIVVKLITLINISTAFIIISSIFALLTIGRASRRLCPQGRVALAIAHKSEQS